MRSVRFFVTTRVCRPARPPDEPTGTVRPAPRGHPPGSQPRSLASRTTNEHAGRGGAMELTSGGLLVVLGLLALIAFGLLVLGLPRTGRRWAGALARGTEALVLTVTVLLFAGAVLNDQYLFYVSWGDLFGSGASVTASHAGGTARQAVEAQAKGPGLGKVPVPRVLPALPAPGQRIQRYTITGPRSHITAEVLVHLPSGYDARAAT